MDSLDILINIRKIVRSINLESKRIQKDFGISIPQLVCLNYLSSKETNSTTHKELMELLSLNSSTITGIVNRLERRGYVRRIADNKDKRITLISLTEEGRDLVNKTPNVFHDKLTKKFDYLPEDKQLLVREALEIIIDSLQIKDIEAAPILTSDELISDYQTCRESPKSHKMADIWAFAL